MIVVAMLKTEAYNLRDKFVLARRQNQHARRARYPVRGSAFPSATSERGKEPRGQLGCDSKCPLDSLGEKSNGLLTQSV